jgi:spindle assembly abnormal protein 6
MLLQENLSQDVSTLKADNGELRAKLEESKQQLQSNEQMIRWLNQQVGGADPAMTSLMQANWQLPTAAAAACAPQPVANHT